VLRAVPFVHRRRDQGRACGPKRGSRPALCSTHMFWRFPLPGKRPPRIAKS
jgi:hypothetical protein